MARTTQQIIDIGWASSIYAANELGGGKRHGGSIDWKWPILLHLVTQGLEWLYELDPADEDLDTIGNYLISISKFSAKAEANIVGGGGSTTITTATPFSFPLRVTGSHFENDGITYNNPNIVGFDLMLFVSNYSQEWQFAPAFFQYTATGIQIVSSGFDANLYDQIIIDRYFTP